MGPEPAASLPEREGEWQLGEPDWIYEFDPIDVAADGPDRFRDLAFEFGFDEDKWIEAVELLPGDSSVLHHFILWADARGKQGQRDWLAGWAAGLPPLLGDFHYHPTGRATTDRSRLGIHFADPAEVKKEFMNLWVANGTFEIPAGHPNYEAKADYVFPQDVKIVTLTPHMHYRGKDIKYTAYLPEGTERELLAVSRYDFNWQTGYQFDEPLDLPAGTRLEVVAHWDNSADNPNNPDPTANVRWGDDSSDEMLIGFVDYFVTEGRSPQTQGLVMAKLAELAQSQPGQAWLFDVPRGPGGSMVPSALLLPRGRQARWLVCSGRNHADGVCR